MTPYGEWHAREMELFVDLLGMSHFEALLSMTRNSAITLPQHAEQIGTLTPGKYADLLVVEGNPDRNVAILQDRKSIRTIVKAGRPVSSWRPTSIPRTKHPFEKTHVYTPQVYRFEERAGTSDSYAALISDL